MSVGNVWTSSRSIGYVSEKPVDISRKYPGQYREVSGEYAVNIWDAMGKRLDIFEKHLVCHRETAGHL
jgi:hypothetical protein